MSKLRDNLDAARRSYASVRYDGDLAERIGLTRAVPRRRSMQWAIAAAVALAALFAWRPVDETPRPMASQTPPPSMPALTPPALSLSFDGLASPAFDRESTSFGLMPTISLDLPSRNIQPQPQQEKSL